MSLTLGAWLSRALAASGFDRAFGIPGVHTVELYRGFSSSGLKHLTARHEQSLGFMADGYARATGRPGLCYVITGPGLTNIATAMAQAYADSIPMLVISAVNPVGRMGSGNGWLHELADQRALARGVAAFSHTILDPMELPQVLARAFAVFDGARPRPVHIEIPVNLFAAPADALPSDWRAPRLRPPVAHPDSIYEAAAALKTARRPLILAGGGGNTAPAELAALARRLGAPVAMTANARGLLAPDDPLGVSFSASLPAVRALIQESDVVLATGTELGPTDYDAYDVGGFSVPGRLIRLEIDAEQMMRVRAPEIALLGAAAPSLAALRAALGEGAPAPNGPARAAEANAAARAGLSDGMRADIDFLERLQALFPESIIVGDSTRMVYAGNLGHAARRRRGWFNAATGFGALGYGLPAAIGAGIADPSKPVICLAGDGGLQFTLSDLGTAIDAGARLRLILLNNRGYGEIRRSMAAVGVEPVGVALHTPDFTALAQGYGWRARRAESPEALLEALAADGPEGGPILYEWTQDD